MQRCHKPKETALGAVNQKMASHSNGIARPDVVAPDSVLFNSRGTGRFQCPHRGLAGLIFDFDEEKGVRVEQLYSPERALKLHPLRQVIVAVGVVRPNR